ncbi:hypothetical protein D3C78_1430210 [compost metagenome]
MPMLLLRLSTLNVELLSIDSTASTNAFTNFSSTGVIILNTLFSLSGVIRVPLVNSLTSVEAII